MEEAYSELYQQFLQLKSLCLRQAALLHQLTETLQKQKSPDGGRWNSAALKYNGFDVLYIWNSLSAGPSVDIPEHPQEKTRPSPCHLTAAGDLPKNKETFSDLLAMDMSKLAVHGGCQSNENQESASNVPPLRSLEPSRWPGGSGDSRLTLLARVGIIPDAKLHLCCKHYHCPHGPRLLCPTTGAGAKHGRRLRQSSRRDTDVWRGAAVSRLRFLPGGFPWRHQHQRRISTPPLHPHHLTYPPPPAWCWESSRDTATQVETVLNRTCEFALVDVFTLDADVSKQSLVVFALILWVFVFVVLTALEKKQHC